MARRSTRLDQPRQPRGLPRPHYDPEAFGRFSEAIARFMGTARFLVIMTAVVFLWVAYNVPARQQDLALCRERGEVAADCRNTYSFDPYPFILLTLALSLQASYAAPLILLAQTRQAERDRISLEEDRAQYARALADTEYLTREMAAIRIALGDVATRDFVRSELQRLADEATGTDPPNRGS